MGGDVGAGSRGGQGRALFDKTGAKIRSLDFLVPSLPLHTFPLRDRGAPGTVARDILGVSPFRVSARSLMSADGTNAMVIEPGALFDAPPGQFRFRRISLTTFQTAAPVTVSMPPHRITSTERDSILDDAARKYPRVEADYKRNARVPEHYPAYDQATLMGDNLLWITEYAIPNAWTMIDMSGRILVRMQFPRTFVPFAASRTQVWGTLKDRDDVQIIVRYRILSERQ